MAGREQRPLTALALALKSYRDHHKFTQEELAALLEVEPRTLRRWENGEVQLENVRDLKYIADRLGIPYEHLGVAASIFVPLTVERIHETVARTWELVDAGRISEARAISENLVREAIYQARTDSPPLIQAFARMYHVAAHATSLSVKTDEVGQALYYYQQMEYFAHLMKDDTLLCVSLTHQGDMLRRKGDFERAITYLESASNIAPQASIDARGNAFQLLARAYSRAKQYSDFDYTIKQAEEVAHMVNQQSSNTGNQFHLTHVYEEYVKNYDRMGKTQLALDYLDRAEKARPSTKSVEILLKVARAEVLIHSGDVRNGEPLAVESAIYTREHGHYRRLERIYALKRFLNQQVLRLSKTEMALSEALEGPIEQH